MVVQAQLDQFLFQMFDRRVFQRVYHIVQKEIGKLLPGPVQGLANPGGREGPAELGGELHCHLGRAQRGMIGPETEHGVEGLSGPGFDLG